jgi:4-carboxymuconolactone decarboxylase
MNEAQRALVAEISSGPRGGVRGPFVPLLYQPELASRVQRLGEFLRFNSLLGQALVEFAILLAGRHWSCQFEWYVHAPLAAKVGVSQAIIDAIAERRLPPDMNDDQKMVYDVCNQIYATGRLSDATFEMAAGRFKREGVLELLAICGYYSLLAFVLNVSDDPLPNGETTPLKHGN